MTPFSHIFPTFPTEGEKLGFQNWKFLKLQIALAPSFFYAERRLIRQIEATNELFHVEQKKVQNCQSWQPCFGKCKKQFFANTQKMPSQISFFFWLKTH